jgi:hypothetical protein
MKKIFATLMLTAMLSAPALAQTDAAPAADAQPAAEAPASSLPPPAQPALTLGERNEMQKWRTSFTDGSGDMHVEYFQQRCGYTLPVTLDDSLAAPFMAKHSNAAGYCDAALSEMGGMCEESAISKEAIATKVKALHCRYSAGDKGSFTLSPEGVLDFSFDVDSSNLEDKTKEFLEKNL